MALRLSGDGSLNLSDVTLDNVTASGLSASGTVSLPPTTSIGNVSDTEIAFVDGVTSSVQTQLNGKLPIAGGKILQIVRATDTTNRSTTSTSFVDASISVTITPQKNDSVILLVHSFYAATEAGNRALVVRITDSSNNVISGAEFANHDSSAGYLVVPTVVIGYATPATTSATTYKLQFRTGGGNPGTVTLANITMTGQLYAIEVSA
jgi:hypothetical protein